MIGFIIFVPIGIIYILLTVFAIFHLLHFGLEKDKIFIKKIIIVFSIISAILLSLFLIFLITAPWDNLLNFNNDIPSY